MFCQVAQLTVVVRGLASPLLGMSVYQFVIYFYLVLSMVLFFVSVFVFGLFQFGFCIF